MINIILSVLVFLSLWIFPPQSLDWSLYGQTMSFLHDFFSTTSSCTFICTALMHHLVVIRAARAGAQSAACITFSIKLQSKVSGRWRRKWVGRCRQFPHRSSSRHCRLHSPQSDHTTTSDPHSPHQSTWTQSWDTSAPGSAPTPHLKHHQLFTTHTPVYMTALKSLRFQIYHCILTNTRPKNVHLLLQVCISLVQ